MPDAPRKWEYAQIQEERVPLGVQWQMFQAKATEVFAETAIAKGITLSPFVTAVMNNAQGQILFVARCKEVD